MGRYSNTNIVKVYDRKTKSYVNKKATTIYENMGDLTLRNDDIYVITQPGDRLDNLAFEYYGDPHLWWFIAHVNNITVMNVEDGTRLRIPASVQNAKGK